MEGDSTRRENRNLGWGGASLGQVRNKGQWKLRHLAREDVEPEPDISCNQTKRSCLKIITIVVVAATIYYHCTPTDRQDFGLGFPGMSFLLTNGKEGFRAGNKTTNYERVLWQATVSNLSSVSGPHELFSDLHTGALALVCQNLGRHITDKKPAPLAFWVEVIYHS